MATGYMFTSSPGSSQRLGVIILFVVSVVLLILEKSESRFTADIRRGAIDMVGPVLDGLSRPVAAVENGIQSVDNLLSVYGDNERLREDNRRLMQWKSAAEVLEHENRRLKALLGVKTDEVIPLVTPRVVGDTGGAFARAVILNAGADDGVREGQAVIDENGLVGHVLETGDQAARVLLLTDLNSRIPVLVGERGFHAMLAGDNSPRPVLKFLPLGAEAKPGDGIMSSGAGGVLPPHLPIGHVAAIEGEVPRVALLANLDRLEYVRVIDYEPPELTPPSGTDEAEAESTAAIAED